MKILLPVDGSDYTKRMLAYLAAHDELLGPQHDYTFYTVVAPLPAHVTRFVERGIIDDHYASQGDQILGPLCAFADQQHWRCQAMHVVGHAADTIARVADAEKFDLIVMGTHGHTALGNVVLGSVANGVLARSKVPVLLVR